MFASIHKVMKLNEQSLSAPIIARLRIFSTLSLIAFPAFTAIKYFGSWDVDSPRARFAVAAIIILMLLPIAFSRLANMLAFTDKYLDEWEIRLKKRAESFGYRCVLFALVALAAVGGFIVDTESVRSLMFSYDDVFFIIGNIFFPLVLLPVAYIAWTQKPLTDT